jgi:integrase
MNATTQADRPQPTKIAKGSDIKTAKPGARLRFGGGLYLLVSPAARSWQVHYHVAGKHQAVIVGRWPELGVEQAKEARDKIRQTVRAGGDPAIERAERRIERRGAEAATVRAVGERWIATASVARGWTPNYLHHTKLRLKNHIYPALGDRPIGRVRTFEIEALIVGLVKNYRSQTEHVRQNLQSIFDYAVRHDLGVTVNPVRKIAEDLPRRIQSEEANRANVESIEDARAVLAAVETYNSGPFAKLAHRLIALTAVRKLEGLEAQWSEIVDGPDGMTWTIPAERMKGRRGKRREHVIPLSPQAADVFRAARELARVSGVKSPFVFPGRGMRGNLARNTPNFLLAYALAGSDLAGRHTVHGWRSTFYTVLKEADYDERLIDAMLAHQPARPSQVAQHYDRSRLIRNGAHLQPLIDRRRLATAWADLLLAGAPSPFALAGLTSNVVRLREAA